MSELGFPVPNIQKKCMKHQSSPYVQPMEKEHFNCILNCYVEVFVLVLVLPFPSPFPTPLFLFRISRKTFINKNTRDTHNR